MSPFHDLSRRLAGTQKRKDEGPNVELAIDIVSRGTPRTMDALAALLDSGNKKRNHDVLKVFIEVGQRTPALLLPHIDLLLEQLESEDNRARWSAMIALSTTVELAPDTLMKSLPHILAAARRSTVIAKDKAMRILASLCALPRHHAEVLPHMLQHVDEARLNQFPTYAELAAASLLAGERKLLLILIEAREDLVDSPPKLKRMQRLKRKLAKGPSSNAKPLSMPCTKSGFKRKSEAN